MQLLAPPASGIQFPMHELEQVEAAIDAAQILITTLQSRKAVLTAALDQLTRPPTPALAVKSRTIGPGFLYQGTMHPQWQGIDIHTALLKRLWVDFPNAREAMASAVGVYGRTRAYVAKSREALFPGQPASFSQRHSRILVDDWYVDTNLNRERMRRILPAAVRAAGLRWGEDVRVYWRATRIE
ncbi:hypothetical protein [Inhella sp.]|uniref:hypothetical protein n=1 Tax=Inhella sp. TaxID=1921806 RepID=UPI0035B43AF4